MNKLLITTALTYGAVAADDLFEVTFDPVDTWGSRYSQLYPEFENELKKHGHGTEYSAYEITTSDGYVITTFHIPANPHVPKKGPVLFQHGYSSSGTRWMANTPAPSWW
mgnify:CR=1 FL=1